jgi:transcriptional regulator with XRE-family HTH domain
MMTKPLLRELLHNRGLNLADLARGLGVDKATVTRWARKGIPAERLPDIVSITGIAATDLRPDLASIFAPASASDPSEAA